MGRKNCGGVYFDFVAIKSALARARLSQRALARAIDVAETALSNACYGRTRLTQENAQRAADVLGVPVDAIVLREAK